MKTRIEVRSKVGHGSVFSVRLPREGSPISLAARQVRVGAANQDLTIRGLKVLCIDDETLILDGMRALLERWGCKVFTAQRIEEAERICAQDSIEVIFADYQLKQDITITL